MAQLRQTDIDPVKDTNPDELTVAPVDPLDQTEIDHDYFKQNKSVRFYRSVLFQMFMFGSYVATSSSTLLISPPLSSPFPPCSFLLPPSLHTIRASPGENKAKDAADLPA